MNVAPNTPLQVSPMANLANAKSTEAMSKLINKFSNKIANINDNEQLEIIKSKIQVIVEIITVLQFNDDIAKNLNFTSNPKLLADYINNLFPPSNTGDIVQVFDENDTQQLFEICEHRNKWWSGNNDKLTRSATTFLNNIGILTNNSRNELNSIKTILTKEYDREVSFNMLCSIGVHDFSWLTPNDKSLALGDADYSNVDFTGVTISSISTTTIAYNTIFDTVTIESIDAFSLLTNINFSCVKSINIKNIKNIIDLKSCLRSNLKTNYDVRTWIRLIDASTVCESHYEKYNLICIMLEIVQNENKVPNKQEIILSSAIKAELADLTFAILFNLLNGFERKLVHTKLNIMIVKFLVTVLDTATLKSINGDDHPFDMLLDSLKTYAKHSFMRNSAYSPPKPYDPGSFIDSNSDGEYKDSME